MAKILYLNQGVQEARQPSRSLLEVTANRDFATSDANQFLFSDSTSDITLTLTTIPNTANTLERWELGTEIEVCQYNTGVVTINEGANVQILAYGSSAPLSLLGSGAVGVLKLIKQDATTDSWLFIGYA
ncbi:MAG: hypothetical protein AAF316_00190 [Cyanobacteria bacterium P01_A01_bin.80]